MGPSLLPDGGQAGGAYEDSSRLEFKQDPSGWEIHSGLTHTAQYNRTFVEHS